MAKKIALLIGVSEYGAGIPPLLSALNDVEAMERVLRNPNLGNFTQVEQLLNPTSEDMRKAILNLFKNANKDDLLLFFFSGHGITNDNNHLYLATRNTSKDDFEATAVYTDFIQDQSKNCYCKRQVLILDACYSGAFANGWHTKSIGLDIKKQLGSEGRVVLTSSSATQTSFAQEGATLSLYTQYLVEGIETGAADSDGDGNIYAQELHAYAKAKVQAVKPKMTPDIILDKEGYNILLASAPRNPEADYRKLVEQYAKNGELNEFAFLVLTPKRKTLGITDTKAEEIETEVLEPFRRRLANLQSYKQAFAKAVEQKYPLDEHILNILKDYQQEVLGLRDEDVASIELEITSLKEEEYQKQLQIQKQREAEALQSLKSLSKQEIERLKPQPEAIAAIESILKPQLEQQAAMKSILKQQPEAAEQLQLQQQGEQKQEVEINTISTKEFEKEIFISYAWGGESENFANNLDQTLQAKGITIIRDKRDLGYKGLIKQFMERIGQGKCVIVVISDKYLKSSNCMFELVEIAANGKFYDRIFPIVLADAQIYKSVQRLKYIKHWEDEIKELDEAMRGVSAANLQGFREDIDLYTMIRNTIAEITNLLKDMNTLTPDIHSQSEFEQLIKAIEDSLLYDNVNVAAGSQDTEVIATIQGLAQRPPKPELPPVSLNLKSKKPEEVKLSELIVDLGQGITLDLVRVPAGKFTMGIPPQEREIALENGLKNGVDPENLTRWLDWSTPQHEIHLQEFLMGKYTVTNAQWRAVMKTNPSEKYDRKFQGDMQPVVGISWYEARAFCQKLSQQTGRDLRLPTEAEWEYACCAGTTTPFAFGNNITTNQVNYDGNNSYNDAPKGKYRECTVDVNSFSPNSWHLYQMHGNVWEWCLDRWHDNYSQKPKRLKSNGNEVWGETNVDEHDNLPRSVRGGSWCYDAFDCRSTNRCWYRAKDSDHDIGFRVVFESS